MSKKWIVPLAQTDWGNVEVSESDLDIPEGADADQVRDLILAKAEEYRVEGAQALQWASSNVAWDDPQPV